MIIDEAHRMKSTGSSTRQVVAEMHINWLLLLTGERVGGQACVWGQARVRDARLRGWNPGWPCLKHSPGCSRHCCSLPAGTPVQNNMRELYGIMNLLNSDEYG